MDKRAVRTPDGAREIIEYNLNVLYHLPKKYKKLDEALENVRGDLLKLLGFCKKTEPIIWKQKYTWFMDNKNLTVKIRGKTTHSVSSRHFNYLCCLGAIKKLKQTENSMTGVNMTFLLNEREKGKFRPINTFTVYQYTQSKLEDMEQRAAELLAHGITPGNISHDKLIASGSNQMAEEVFYANSEISIQRKRVVFAQVQEQLQRLCTENGYTTKDELCQVLAWDRNRLDVILNTFKSEWIEEYRYKAPTRTEAERFNLTSKIWIITRRNENGQN